MPGGLRANPGGDGCGISGASRAAWLGLSPGCFSLTGQLRAVKGTVHANKGKAALSGTADGCPEQPQKGPVFPQHNRGLINQSNYQAHTIKNVHIFSVCACRNQSCERTKAFVTRLLSWQ